MNRNFRKLFALFALLCWVSASAWPGMEMPTLHVDGRYLKDETGKIVNLHGFAQTYSPWFNEQGSKWTNYDVNGCLEYNKAKIDELLAAGWKMNFVRMHMDPYWSNTPGVATKGENDISAFDFNRFKTYLDKVFIPMAEYAISKGLYVVMRPPGVCPENIEVGGSYHKYLKRVWGYVSTQTKLTNNPHVMFELANEPINIMDTDGQYRSNTDGCFRNLTQYFQEIVDLMRNNGCKNILWIPGTGYQSQYAGFVKYPIKGDNIGYAVHVYPGWYGSDAIEPSHELGGSYGGGFDAFQSGWNAQIRPVAEIAPVMVTEMDWAPSKYDASWGKSITGKMLGEGFGANFKVLADKTGNVSWLIFTGADLLGRFRDVPGTPGNYTLYNDPDACLWPVYHWLKEYAGDEMAAPSSVNLYFSPRLDDAGTERMVVTGSSMACGVIASYEGYESNLSTDMDVTVADPSVIEWNDGNLTAREIGETNVTIRYTYGGKSETTELKLTSTPFPFLNRYFNPSIWEKGSLDPATHTIVTGQYGFAGWQYTDGLDLSKYNYLIAEMEGDNTCGVSFRVFDLNNYWSDPTMVDFKNSKRVVIDLNNMKSDKGRKLDKSHIYIVGFWSLGNREFRIKHVYPAMTADASGIDGIIADEEDGPVDVYDFYGRVVKRQVPRSEATEGLAPGIYIAGGRKIAVKP